MTKEGKKDILILAIIVAVILVSILILISKIKQQIAKNPIEQNQEKYQEVNEEKNAQTVTESFVGYYADVDGDAVVDGVIYADLFTGKTGQWENSDGVYTIPKISASELKDYKVIQENYSSGGFGTGKVLQAVNPNDSSKKDRFYVMALNDIDNQINGTRYHWWYNAYRSGISDYSEKTSTGFGTGYNNTKNIMENWNSNSPYGEHDMGTYEDIWGQITKQYEKGWFVPSREEWAAFADAFGITSSNYKSSFELSDFYWSSSLYNEYYAWFPYFQYCIMGDEINSHYYVRLSTTF